MNPSTTWISCGVLRGELEELHRSGRLNGNLLFLDSMLHMHPQTLETTLSATLEQSVAGGERVVVVYGDCSCRMLDLVRDFQVGRVHAVNCAQMLVGRARYHELMQAQAFILLPEWALRWKEIMQRELGLSSSVARDLMRENRKELVYLDTGLAPVPCAELDGCADYSGLPWRVEPVTLDHLLELLLEAEASVCSPGEESP
jgi:hypothetical protein